MILDLLASGAISLTAVRLLRRHLTTENHEAVLAKASGRTLDEIDLLVAELAPRPDVPSSVRKLPTLSAPVASLPASPEQADAATASAPPTPPTVSTPPLPALIQTPRPIVQPLAPERYRVQFTVGQETHEKLRRVQALLRREIPDGDPAVIFDRALTLLLAKVEKAKLGASTKPRARQATRPKTDTRHIPAAVKRQVWRRDGGQCAFVAASGRRCTERHYLEFHHGPVPRAKHGPATIDNIALRCWRHNQYEAELIFGPHGASTVREPGGSLSRPVSCHQT